MLLNTTTLGKGCLAIWRFMDSGYIFLDMKHSRTLMVNNKYPIKDEKLKSESVFSLDTASMDGGHLKY